MENTTNNDKLAEDGRVGSGDLLGARERPPPGMARLANGDTVKSGDWFYIESWGAWTPVPASAIGQRITGARVARKLAPKVKDEPRRH